MMNQKQSLRDHPMIRCPQNTQQTDGRTPHTEAHASSLKLLFSMNASNLCRHIPKMEHLQRVASDAFTTHSSLLLETYTLGNTIQ